MTIRELIDRLEKLAAHMADDTPVVVVVGEDYFDVAIMVEPDLMRGPPHCILCVDAVTDTPAGLPEPPR